MTKIKIAHILHSVGGVDVSLRLIVNNLDSEKFENIIIHGKLDTNVPFLDSQGKHLREYRTTILRDISLLQDLKSLLQTYRILKKERPNIIHGHSAKGGVIGRVIGRFLDINVLYTPQAFSYLSTQNEVKKIIFRAIEKLLMNKKNFLLASSNSEKERAVAEVGYKLENTLLFNNCIEPMEAIVPLTIDKTWPDNYICTVGRPSYQKNIELMIRVLYEVKKERKIHLVIMGVGHHVGQLESVMNLIKDLDMSEDVTLLEWTERTDVFNIINQSKFYISTARYEGLPYSIIESLALSKPCIVSDCDGNRDLIIDDYNGYIIKNKEIGLFKEKTIKLLDDNVLRDKLSKTALKSFTENYDINKNIFDLQSIYLKYS